MASVIEGYSYDIFVSYRQKDNKHDGWVTEFVNNLKGELESTFKEEISVYFDINPHDGLLETYDVDESLKEKLKCLVFIPIISRTYCDPKSFAWEHEFKAFVEQASKDQFGLKVKLPNGNVANRVLSIRIHDLDMDDIKLCESILGGALRGIEFIYKEPGVNKPLTADDDEKKNLNNTKYKIQINKTANAIKEIVQRMNAEPFLLVKEIPRLKTIEEVRKEERKEVHEKPPKLPKNKLLLGAVITLILVIVAIIAYPKTFKKNTLRELRSSGERISVAVMPFQNLTNDTLLYRWQEGIQINLINILSNYSDELKVKQAEIINNMIQSKGLINYASITQSNARYISRKLDADIFIFGSINKAGSLIRVNAQLINTKSKEVYMPFQIDGTADKIINIIDSLSVQVKNFLMISLLKKDVYLGYQRFITNSTNNLEAFQYLTNAQKAHHWERDYSTALKLYSKAIAIDSNLFLATIMIGWVYFDQGLYDEGKKWCSRSYENRFNMPLQYRIMISWQHAAFFETAYEQIKYLKQLQEFDDQIPDSYNELGWIYYLLFQYDKVIIQLERALELYNKMGIKPHYPDNYFFLGEAYHKTHMYSKEKKLYKTAEIEYPDNSGIVYRQVILLLTEGDIKQANIYIERYKSICKENSWTEADIISSLANIYSEAGIHEKSEVYYKQALSLEPDNPTRLNALAYLLIDKDRNINEGIELVDKALVLSPDNYDFLDTKGWGLYKQMKYNEALDILQKSWDLRRKNAIYDHSAFLHLEAAKKAVAQHK